MDVLALPSPAQRQQFHAAVSEDAASHCAAGAAPSVRDLYTATCRLLRKRQNSQLLRSLPADTADWQITEFRISSNLIGYAGTLAAVVAACRKLTTLDLRSCGLTDEGMPLLLSAALHSESLTCVDVSDNPRLTDQTARSMITLVGRKRDLLFARMECCDAPKHSMRRLRDRCASKYLSKATGWPEVDTVQGGSGARVRRGAPDFSPDAVYSGESLRNYLALLAVDMDAAPAAAEAAAREARRQHLLDYLRAAAQVSSWLEMVRPSDDTVSLAEFAGTAGITVEEAAARFAPYELTAACRVCLQDCGRAFA
eukprot:TRINITY_DN14548_c0_g1_i1.p1 TRINITY_DN14548_c0_g1~~TRINITY_DN14548_c0_g1_i1.p1  ORF type:complete len:331 (+),score=69.18 TRINITY_DN14548_c0_g1_i1:61-993(+)